VFLNEAEDRHLRSHKLTGGSCLCSESSGQVWVWLGWVIRGCVCVCVWEGQSRDIPSWLHENESFKPLLKDRTTCPVCFTTGSPLQNIAMPHYHATRTNMHTWNRTRTQRSFSTTDNADPNKQLSLDSKKITTQRFPTEMNNSGSKTLTICIPFHTNYIKGADYQLIKTSLHVVPRKIRCFMSLKHLYPSAWLVYIT